METEIRSLLTPDIDPGTFIPEDPGRFMFLVQMIAGPAGEDGEESFSFEVCTPGWLQEKTQAEGPVSGRHRVIVDAFDWPALQRYFERLVSRCGGRDWHETAVKLSRYGQWEFEDYRPGPGSRTLLPKPARCCDSRNALLADRLIMRIREPVFRPLEIAHSGGMRATGHGLTLTHAGAGVSAE